MVNEFEATKLNVINPAEVIPAQDVKVYKSDSLNLSLKGTTLGEESEFEKSLKGSIPESEEIAISEPLKAVEDKIVNSEEKTEVSFTVIEETQVDDTIEQKNIVPDQTTEISQAQVKNEQVYKESKKEDVTNDVYGMALKNYNIGDIIKGTVLSIEKAGIFVDIGYKCEGFVANEEVSGKNLIKIGDIVLLYLMQLETKEGYTLLSKKRADWELTWKEAYQLYKLKEVVEVNVENTVKGGIVVNYKGLKGFIPSSLISRSKSEQLNNLVGTDLPVIFVEVDKKRKKIIFSNKSVDRQEASDAPNPLDSLEVGQVIKGKVTSIKDFGAFVNINGVEGLIHISEISWDRIDKVEDVLKVGDLIDVFILGIDKDSRKVSLGLKQLSPDPWEKVEEIYPIGSTVNGTISRITTFGAFVKLEKGLEGLIHISELSHDHVKKVEDVVHSGQQVEVKVLRIIPEEQKIGLSIKQLLEPVVSDEAQELEEQSEEANNEING